MEKSQQKAKLNTPALQWLWKATGRSKHHLVGLVVLQTALNLFVVLYALGFRELVDRAVAGDRDGFLGAMVFLAALAVLRIGLRGGIVLEAMFAEVK